MRQRIFYAVVSCAVVAAALFAFLPTLRHFIWLGIFWGVIAVSVIAVAGVLVNIGSVMVSMYTGYSNESEKSETVKESPGELVQFSRAGVTGQGQVEQRLNTIGELYRAERALSNLQSSSVFQAFSDMQKEQYDQVLGDVRSLIREIAKESFESKMTS
jgi:hypothetical protein